MVRADRSAWSDLAFAAGAGGDGQVVDLHRRARFGVLLAAQYDRQEADLPLLRFLLEQEIVWYREVDAWGWSSALERAGLLVAEHRQLGDVWLQWQLKRLSFDTALGYRTFYLLAGGVAATVAEVRASDHPDREWLLRELLGAGHGGDPDPDPPQASRFTDADVTGWLADRRARFPDDPTVEDARTWATHASVLGDRDASGRFIRQWAQSQPRTWSTLNTLQYHLAQLGLLQEAITAQTEALDVSEPGWSTASGCLRLAELHRLAGDYRSARQAADRCAGALPGDRAGIAQGLWRHYLRELFLLVPLAPTTGDARRLLADATGQLAGIPRLWMDRVLDAAETAVNHAGDEQMRHHYQALRRTADDESHQALARIEPTNPPP